MKKQSIPCLVCKVACYKNQNLVCCKICRFYAPLTCSKVGMNFGNHNFTCTGCHQKKALITELVKSTCDSMDSEDQSSYYSVEGMSKIQNKNLGDISIVHVNARSLVLNFDSIISFLEKANLPEIICISETRLRDKKIKWQKKLVTIPNYDLVYDNSLTSAGGIAVYAKQDIFKYKVRKDLKLDVPECESIFLEIDVPDKTSENVKTLLLGAVYRHPKSNTTLFIDKLCNTLEK